MDAVDAAMRAVDRAAFLPSARRHRAGDDAPVPIGGGQTSSQPRTVAAMLRLLDVRPGHRVLDIGAGSEWTTALLAELVGPTGSVLGLELRPGLAATGAANVAATGRPWARVEPADPDVLGRPTAAPFDRVLVSAMATRLPHVLVDQVAGGGVLVVPVAGRMLRVAVDHARRTCVDEHGAYRFVPLVE